MYSDSALKEMLEQFRQKIMNDIKQILKNNLNPPHDNSAGYKTTDVRKMLKCSTNKLISLRINRKLRTKKIGGTLYYNKEDIKVLLEEGF